MDNRKIAVDLPGGGRAWFNTVEEVAEYAAAMARRRGAVYVGIAHPSVTARRAALLQRDDDPEAEAEETNGGAARRTGEHPAWTSRDVRALVRATSDKAAQLAKAAVELGNDMPIADLAKLLKTHPSGLARPRWKLEQDAGRLHPGLPVPVVFTGPAGRTTVRINQSFLIAAKEASMR